MAEALIFTALNNVAKKVGAIGKNKRNTQGSGFMYRGVDDVMNALHDILAEEGITVVPEVLSVDRSERTTAKGAVLLFTQAMIRYTFYALDGSSISATVMGEGMDSGDKSSNKAMSVALKYCMFQVFCIPTEETKDVKMVDPDQDTYQVTASSTPRRQMVNTKNGPVPKAYFDAMMLEWNGQKLGAIYATDRDRFDSLSQIGEPAIKDACHLILKYKEGKR